MNAFSKTPFIEKVEKVGLHTYDSEPNDDNYPQQWHLSQTNDCDIDAPEAWNIQKGNDSVILAIIDTGVQYYHLDLDNNIWINPGEIGLDQWGFPRETNTRDDDNNGYVDDVYGYDFEDDDNDPVDLDGHGTHIAGIAAAETNNGRGVAGVAGGWNPESDYGQKGCKIMCLRAGDLTDMSIAAEAIVYATDNGAFATNCSWRNSDTGGLGVAVDYAIQNGVLIVASEPPMKPVL
ncbi:MAG: S8 family serine peptidase [Flavobacteriaceae bacterium]|nr:S8 family serine peptidase [Flavobacteriaceae bacterium]